jgi:2-iminobutanoate/2-iminopropanoate deaminase
MPAKQRMSSPHVPEPPPQTWSNCLVVGNQVFTAGMTARTGTEVVGGVSMYEQARVVKVNIFVTDITRREEVWQARREFFTGHFPVSTLVEVSALAAPELLIEIEAVAILGAAPH